MMFFFFSFEFEGIVINFCPFFLIFNLKVLFHRICFRNKVGYTKSFGYCTFLRLNFVSSNIHPTNILIKIVIFFQMSISQFKSSPSNSTSPRKKSPFSSYYLIFYLQFSFFFFRKKAQDQDVKKQFKEKSEKRNGKTRWKEIFLKENMKMRKIIVIVLCENI